jgi:hypothetical protein
VSGLEKNQYIMEESGQKKLTAVSATALQIAIF